MRTKHVLLLGALLTRAVTPVAQSPAFEIASIRSNQEATGGAEINPRPNGRFMATGATVRALILRAYAFTKPS